MRTKKHDWIDVRGYKPQYGFQVFHDGRWRNAAKNGKPLLFDTETDRDQKRAEYRKMKAPDNVDFSGSTPLYGGESAGK